MKRRSSSPVRFAFTLGLAASSLVLGCAVETNSSESFDEENFDEESYESTLDAAPNFDSTAADSLQQPTAMGAISIRGVSGSFGWNKKFLSYTVPAAQGDRLRFELQNKAVLGSSATGFRLALYKQNRAGLPTGRALAVGASEDHGRTVVLDYTAATDVALAVVVYRLTNGSPIGAFDLGLRINPGDNNACTAGEDDCNTNEYCQLPVGLCSSNARQNGICTTLSRVCTQNYAPVCGCDGETYSNACHAASAGVSVAHEGTCAPPENSIREQVALGDHHGCHLKGDGSVWCWGLSYLADGGESQSTVPQQVVGMDGTSSASKAIAISARSGAHTCAVMQSGAVLCWGSNQYGQLGDGTTSSSSFPKMVFGLDGSSSERTAVSVLASASHSCAILASGSTKCWGYNQTAELGNGTTVSSLVPTHTRGLDGRSPETTATFLDSFVGQTCAIVQTGAVKCWGSDIRPVELAPRLVAGTDAPGFRAVSLSLSAYSIFAVLEDGRLIAWPNRSAFDTSGSIFNHFGEQKVASFAAGFDTQCAVLDDGAARCWGSGFLGDGTGNRSSTPVQVVGIDGANATRRATQVSLGWSHACVVREEGVPQCWGYGNFGKLGNGSTADYSRVPLPLAY